MRALQVKATLRYARPPIWRRLLVAEDTSLQALHSTIQIAMGWMDCHLYAFLKDGRQYLDPERFVDPCGDWRDAREVRLSELRLGEESRFGYVYDFGDGWEHDLLVEAALPSSEAGALPACLKGRRACPPEDCGGVHGYDRLLEAVREPAGADPELLEWIPEGFDPERFDLAEVNDLLRSTFPVKGKVLRFPDRRGRR